MYYRDTDLNFQAMTITLQVPTDPIIQELSAQT